MRNYIVKRLLLIPFTLLGILLINFAIIQLAPGGPVEHTLAKYRGMNVNATAQISSGVELQAAGDNMYRGAQGVPEELIRELEKQFGFDKPVHERLWKMIKDYACFDFGRSYYQDKSVLELIGERMPVSISLGLWSTLIIYLIAIPLGIKKAVEELIRDTRSHQSHISSQVKALMSVIETYPMSATELMEKLGLKSRAAFRKNYLQPCLAAGLIAMTDPENKTSRNQRYFRI